MDFIPLSDIAQLTSQQRALLKKANILNVSDLFLAAPKDIAQKSKLSPIVVHDILSTVARAVKPVLRPLNELIVDSPHIFTTGEPLLDSILGSGFRTGMVWEIVGESAAGKTQFALQLSLSVQLPLDQSGLLGSTCYLTTSASLQTTRLVEMIDERSTFQQGGCSLDNIHTIETPTTHVLMHVLTSVMPTFLKQSAANGRPVKLLVLDAIAELFHLDDKKSTKSLVDRARELNEIAAKLHSLAREHNLAVLVLNEVVDAFSRPKSPDDSSEQLLYSEQSKWFNRAADVPGGSTKEASLGLVWANQVNARIFLHRTHRRIHIQDFPAKRRRLDGDQYCEDTDTLSQPTLLRRLNIVFSSVGPPAILDYFVTTAGIVVHQVVSLLDESIPPSIQSSSPPTAIFSSSPKHATPSTQPADYISSDIFSPPEFQSSLEPISSQAGVAPLDLGDADTGNSKDDSDCNIIPSSQDDETTLLW